jgi:Collagen triple helix repeat (20 copies)
MMFSRLREHLGTAGLVVAIVALVAALAGGAIAATGGSDGKATASAKTKKGPRGPKGPKGDPGPAGPAGPQGAAGVKGDAGAAGSNGKDGATGPKGATGPTGTTGNTGPTGTSGFTKTLPSEMTETGAWWFASKGDSEEIEVISFPIPLSAADAASVTVHYWRKTVGEDPECPGSPAEPTAEPGALCLYVASGTLVNNPEVYNPNFANSVTEPPGVETLGVGPSGALLYLEGPLFANQHLGGTFALTAPSP